MTEESKVFNSKAELRRLLTSNAISLNKEKINTERFVTINDLINNKYLLFQKGKGKKNYIIL